MSTLNEVFSALSVRRRYEVWFLRMGLADGSGAWWFRYLLMNPGRGGCVENPRGMPVQVWATWFPAEGAPHSFIQGVPLQGLDISDRGKCPFHFRIGDNGIEEESCRGALKTEGHSISWNLRYRSTFRATLSSKGWIGFSRTPHSDATFSGQIEFDGRFFPATHWDSEYKAITADTGIAIFGLGRTPIFPAPVSLPAPWRRCVTRCRSG